MDQIFTNKPQRRMQNLIGSSLLCKTTTLKPLAILVREHVGEMFSYLNQENWNESKKHSHNWTQSRILLFSHTRRQIKKSSLGKIGRITAFDPAKP
jgi:ABC-type phosphate/phosphonate transport system ATPase subunit